MFARQDQVLTGLPRGHRMAEVKIVRLSNSTAYLFDFIARGVFDEAIKPAQRDAFLAEKNHHMILAVHDEQVVGMASAVKYLHPDKLPSLWINEIGVGDDWLRQGIGKKLMDSMLELAEELGCEEAWLGTELDNAPALALYRSSNGEEEAGAYFTWDTEAD